MTAPANPLMKPSWWDSALRDATWLDRARAMRYSIVLLLVAVAFALSALIVHGRGGMSGPDPFNNDFVSFWSASRLALDGTPELAYVPKAHGAVERLAYGEAAIPYYAFFYPPVFLMICLPLALLPLGASCWLWLLATAAPYLAALWRLLPPSIGWRRVLCFTFPAIGLNAAYGQNGYLSAAVMAAGLMLLRERPLVAGLAFGCLVFKPQLAILLPLALAAGGYWRTFFVTAATAALLMLVSLALFGWQTWEAFFANSALAQRVLTDDLVSSWKMASVYAGVKLLGGGAGLAASAQAIAAAVAAGFVVRVARARPDPLDLGAVLVAATLLTTPFVLVYDLTLLAIPLALLIRSGSTTGFRPYEKIAILAGCVAPMLMLPAGEYLHLPLAPPVVAIVYAVLVRRGLQPAPLSESRPAPLRFLEPRADRGATAAGAV